MKIPEVSSEDWQHAVKLTYQYAPLKIPKDWNRRNAQEGFIVYRHTSGLEVILSVDDKFGDGRTWIHCSCAYSDKLPTYNEVCLVKRFFIGTNRKALMIFPEERNHVNIHSYALHLWSAIEGDNLPEFGIEGTI
jgi:hypothetical protein